MGGETLGFPKWMPFPQGNIWGALLPIDPSCEFGPCVPIGNGVAPAVAAIGACASNPACVTAVMTLMTATLMYLQHILPLPRATHNSTETPHGYEMCRLGGEFEDASVDQKYKLCAYSCESGQSMTIIWPRGGSCPATQVRIH